MKQQRLNKLLKLTTGEVREELTKEMVVDYLICVLDDIPVHSWLEDTMEAPEDYNYSTSDLEVFLFKLEVGQ